jgi:hypothetical protein
LRKILMKSVYMMIVLLGLLVGCSGQTAAPTAAPTEEATAADLTAIKTYLLDKTAGLQSQSKALQTAAGDYYTLAEAAGFDYAALWQEKPAEVGTALLAAQAAWMAASPGYEQIEGIVAGVPSLAEYDVILDAGAAGEGEDAAPYDLTLPNGEVLARPGNLFGVLEGALWGTRPEWAMQTADLDGDGQVEFGEALPEANLVKGAADTLVDYVGELQVSAEAWQPTESDAFTALVVMIPTMSEYFESWKNSRFVAGEASIQSDFVVISRLADIQDILGSLQVVHGGLSPMIASVDTEQNRQIEQGLADLKAYVAGIYAQEQEGKQFTAEEADTLGAEAQDRATALAGQVAQAAAQLDVEITE